MPPLPNPVVPSLSPSSFFDQYAEYPVNEHRPMGSGPFIKNVEQLKFCCFDWYSDTCFQQALKGREVKFQMQLIGCKGEPSMPGRKEN